MKEYKLPETLRQLMEENDLSDFKLSLEINISEYTIHKAKMGYSFPSVTTVMELADFFNVSTDYLIYGEENV